MKRKKIEEMTIKTASEISGIPEQTIRIGLQRGLLPFGTAYQVSDKSQRYRYIIYPLKFYEYFRKKGA